MLSEKYQDLRDRVQRREFKEKRVSHDVDLRRSFRKQKLNFAQRSAMLLQHTCNAEDPIVFKDEKITFTRSRSNIPVYYDRKSIKSEYFVRKGDVYDVIHNLTPKYEILLEYGLQNRLDLINEQISKCKNRRDKKYLNAMAQTIHSVLGLAHRYEKMAIAVGNEEVAAAMRNVPRNRPDSFLEALQSVRFISSMFYLVDNYQFGFGRMDQYFYPFYKRDIEAKRITQEQAKELLHEFFISLNKDTDLYRGVQQGDNGQSVMLGGCKADGTSAVNELTYMILEVSRDLKLIDPKINLRVDSNTPDDLIKLGCELTKCGLGFPQYANDEVVIPALVKRGYSLEDAREYTVAACWEFIIPGKGVDIVNQGAISFPSAVDNALEKCVNSFFGFSIEKLRRAIKQELMNQTKVVLSKRNIHTLPSPFASIFFDGTIESCKDASEVAKYRNVGIHGAGSSNAADALAAIKTIYDESGLAGVKELCKAKRANFVGYEELRSRIVNEIAKVGNDNDYVDSELKFLFDTYADCADELSTKDRKIRPGSGSAMFYVLLTGSKFRWMIEPVVKATADGRLDKQSLSTSLAPSHNIKVDGVLSVLKSFSKIDYSRIMNGGPITIELTPSVFDSESGIDKLAMLIKYFVKLGNQQLQLNVLDAAMLEDAMKNPDAYRNLIVRVWGWSGYFCELDKPYQQHIINRHKYTL